MRLMLKLTETLWIKRLGAVWHYAFLTAVLVLSGCAGLKKFPTKNLYESDPRDGCFLYKIVDEENFKFELVGEVDCRSVFGFSDEDIPKVMNWLQDAKEYGKKHCK